MNKEKVEAFLGVPYSTAMYELHKMLLLDLARSCGKSVCYRCGKEITEPHDLTVDHKKSWLGIGVDLFWDLNNVAFSHHSCNSKRENWHPSEETKQKLKVKPDGFNKKVSEGMLRYHLNKRLSGN